ncbi:MAG: c-type cytochrome [Gemmatimonadetes bacterium]|nr:c-type cytochrome [Gemmatimonadota bacterium]
MRAIVIAAGISLLGLSPTRAQWLELRVPARPKVDSAAVARGKVIYQDKCASCHGDQGDGNGPVAPYLWPRPRDLTAASYMLRTTASGELPTDEDLFRTITLGMMGTGMPAWGQALSVEQRWQVIFYIKTFAADLFDNPAMDPYQHMVKRAKAPRGSKSEMIAEGRKWYEKAKCAECHGASGRGDGGKGADLRDDRGYPSRPLDMYLKWKFKGGQTVEDFYTRLTTGLDGTPMPSYAKDLTDDQRWQLAHYSMSLPDLSAQERTTPTVLEARPGGNPLPSNADDPAWETAAEFLLPLTGQATFRPRWQIPSVTDLSVRALFNDRELALRLSWDDTRPDTLPGDSAQAAADGWRSDSMFPVIFADSGRVRNRYPDAAETMLPAKLGQAGPLPHFVYGSPSDPVDLWRWSAEHGAVSHLRATGADGPPKTQDSVEQHVHDASQWKDGRWTVVIRVPLGSEAAADGHTHDAGVVYSETGQFIPVAFHVWDGGNSETGLRMALSSWYYVKVGPPASPVRYLLVLLALGGAIVAEYGMVRWTRKRGARGELVEYGVRPDEVKS